MVRTSRSGHNTTALGVHVRLGRQRFPSHVAALDELPSELLLDLCSDQAPFLRLWCFGRHTMDAAFQVLAFQGVTHGTTASSWRGKVAGQSLRISGACVAKTGDGAWLKQVVGLMVWCCWLCNARFVAGSCDDASLAAGWRSSPVDTRAFWAELSTSGQFCSKVWSIPGMRIECSDLILCTWLIWRSRNTSAVTSAGSCHACIACRVRPNLGER